MSPSTSWSSTTKSNSAPQEVHELVIIGGGPAALSAALYAGRAGIEAVVFERNQIGGTLNEISKINNYPGFDGAGSDLGQLMRRQAEASGVKIQYGDCTGLQLSSKLSRELIKLGASFGTVENGGNASTGANFLLTVDAEPVAAQTVIIATGSVPRTLGFPLTTAVSYCALCDGVLAHNKNVAVIGGGNSAFQEALYLADIVARLTLITHSTAKADAWLQDRLRRLPNVTILEQLEPTPDLLNQFDYVFVYIGKQPSTAMLKRLNQQLRHQSGSSYNDSTITLLDKTGYIIASQAKTIVPGLFAAGDICSGAVRQVVTAAAAGAEAALAASNFLRNS